MNKQIFTVSELNNQINNLVESRLPQIIVKGEISGLKPPPHGHMYFNIKDDSASLPCAIWSYKRKLTDYIPKEGDEVLIEGKPSFWVKGGALKLHVDKISLAGEGDLWAKFQALKKKLLQEGLFESSHKKKLPKYPRKIAIITSVTGSVIKDILDVISRNSSYLNVVVRNCKMQGDEAVEDLMNAIDDIHNAQIKVDAIIIARGGGSLEDLWCFNNEQLAYKIFDSKIPIVSAVGHETDTTIADLVSDKRAGTPSIAAEIIAPSTDECLQSIAYFQDGILDIIQNKIEKHFLELKNIKQRHGLHKTKYVLSNHSDRFLRIKKLLSPLNFDKYLKLKKDRIDDLYRSINIKIQHSIQSRHDKVNYLDSYSKSFNPENVMKRGYSVVYGEDGEIVKQSKNIKNKDKLDIKLYSGKLKVEVLKSNIDKESK